MKQLLFILLLFATACFSAHAERLKLVPSAGDSTRMDTLVISQPEDVETIDEWQADDGQSLFGKENIPALSTIALVSIIICCGLPLFIVALVLWFRYKNKQAKYKLAAKALATGQSIPKDLFSNPEDQHRQVLSKGIRNVFLSIGWGVVLWTWTREEGLAVIGFLIFCMGVGQILIAYTYTSRDKKDE